MRVAKTRYLKRALSSTYIRTVLVLTTEITIPAPATLPTMLLGAHPTSLPTGLDIVVSHDAMCHLIPNPPPDPNPNRLFSTLCHFLMLVTPANAAALVRFGRRRRDGTSPHTGDAIQEEEDHHHSLKIHKNLELFPLKFLLVLMDNLFNNVSCYLNTVSVC